MINESLHRICQGIQLILLIFSNFIITIYSLSAVQHFIPNQIYLGAKYTVTICA